MSEDFLFLLWTFIVPVFTVTRQFLKTVNVHKKQPLSEIMLITSVMALIWAAIGCFWGVMLMGAVSDSFLLRCVLGNVVFSGVTLLFLGTQSLAHPLKKILFFLFALFNLITVFVGLLTHSFSAGILIIILLTYPFVSVYQFLLNYIGKEEVKNPRKADG